MFSDTFGPPQVNDLSREQIVLAASGPVTDDIVSAAVAQPKSKLAAMADKQYNGIAQLLRREWSRPGLLRN